MKTADLILQLTRDSTPVSRGIVARRLAPPTSVGVVTAAILVVLWLGLRPLDQAAHTFAFWMKAGYTSLLALAATGVMARLSRPGGQVGGGRWIAFVAIGLMLLLSAREYAAAPHGARLALWLGGSWKLCPFRIVAVAAPIYAGLLFGLRRLAPTRLAAAGAAAGFLAGALGATVYQLFCPETGAMFVTTWYSLGIGFSTALGAMIGIRALRW